jgi:N-acetylmuramate 1-kinase
LASHHELILADEASTVHLAQDIAAIARPGDVIGLSGDLGAGKSTFARAFIRALVNNPALDVPSPTFTLVQEYQTPRARILHADLYRIASIDDLTGLGLTEDTDDAILLVEWSDKAADALDGPNHLELSFRISAGNSEFSRIVDLMAAEGWSDRLKIGLAVRAMLTDANWSQAQRTHMQGDASTRAYERLKQPSGEQAVLMISPPRADGPPIRSGKPYSAIAKLAESVHAFVAMDKGLIALGLSAPVILASDLSTGLLLIEDLGAEALVDANGPMAERYEEAARVLADIHREPRPTILPVEGDLDHVIPDYDREALDIETELLLDWYAPHAAGAGIPAVGRAAFARVFGPLLDEALDGDINWVLRDYHSPNLIWLAEREGLKRVGIIDFQDAVRGPCAYDLVSLAQDARVDVSSALEMKLLIAYVGARRAATPDFDASAFIRSYAIMGAQRATKILGIFARLDKRDGKPAYLKHMPRMEDYLRRNLAHPALSELRSWYEQYLPRIVSLS